MHPSSVIKKINHTHVHVHTCNQMADLEKSYISGQLGLKSLYLKLNSELEPKRVVLDLFPLLA